MADDTRCKVQSAREPVAVPSVGELSEDLEGHWPTRTAMAEYVRDKYLLPLAQRQPTAPKLPDVKRLSFIISGLSEDRWSRTNGHNPFWDDAAKRVLTELAPRQPAQEALVAPPEYLKPGPTHPVTVARRDLEAARAELAAVKEELAVANAELDVLQNSQLGEAMSCLELLASYVGANGQTDPHTVKQLDERIRWGIDFNVDVWRKRAESAEADLARLRGAANKVRSSAFNLVCERKEITLPTEPLLELYRTLDALSGAEPEAPAQPDPRAWEDLSEDEKVASDLQRFGVLPGAYGPDQPDALEQLQSLDDADDEVCACSCRCTAQVDHYGDKCGMCREACFP